MSGLCMMNVVREGFFGEDDWGVDHDEDDRVFTEVTQVNEHPGTVGTYRCASPDVSVQYPTPISRCNILAPTCGDRLSEAMAWATSTAVPSTRSPLAGSSQHCPHAFHHRRTRQHMRPRVFC
jgi:hypothetical protein